MDGKRIVIVEDERIIAEDIKSTLTTFNYNVLGIFSRGEDALIAVLDLKPDLVMMDIMLAGDLNGVQTAAGIKKLMEIPIIYLTAFANEKILEEAKLTQPYGYLIKPFQERELYATIEMAFYRHQLEQDLKSSEKKYRTLFNSLSDPVFIFKRNDHRFLDCNRVVQEIYGYSKEELAGMSIFDLHPPSEAEKMAENFDQPDEHNQVYHHLTKSGDMMIVTIKTSDIFYEGCPARLSIVHDITKRVLAEEKLQKTQMRLSTVFHNVPDIVLFESGDDRQFISGNVNVLLGFDKDRHITDKNQFMELLHEEDRKDVIARINEWKSNEGESQLSLWYRIRAASGQVIWIEDRMVKVKTGTGTSFVTGVLINTSELKKAEAEKEKIREQLYQSQKMEVIGKLAGGIAHDFNNLLTAINGYADLALKKIDADHSAFDDIQVVKDCGLKAAKLTQQLLGFSRKQIVERKLIDLNRIISELLKMLTRLIGSDIKLELQLSDKSSCVLADAGQIEQVLINLVVNARDALPLGGNIFISTSLRTISTAELSLHQLDNPGDFVVISVSDNGCGMTEEVISHIFEPFFTTKEPGKGTGLGLATVFGIVKQNEGFVEVDSEPDKGTTFRVYLPKAAGKEKKETVEILPEKKADLVMKKCEETILLVEDEEAIREFVLSILEEAGYTVLAAEGGNEGLQAAVDHNGKIDLLLSDIRMPGLSGPDLAVRLKQKHPETRILFVSGHTDNEEVRKQIGNADCAFLQKPFTFESLLNKIRSELDRR